MADTPDTTTEGLDKVAEYFKLKRAVKELRSDMKDFVTQHPVYEESQKLGKQLKKMRDEIKDEETIKEIREKLQEVQERMDLLKEMIRIELIENAEEEVEKDGLKLKLIYVIKEMRSEEKSDKR